jgi:hypothetical protein
VYRFLVDDGPCDKNPTLQRQLTLANRADVKKWPVDSKKKQMVIGDLKNCRVVRLA